MMSSESCFVISERFGLNARFWLLKKLNLRGQNFHKNRLHWSIQYNTCINLYDCTRSLSYFITEGARFSESIQFVSLSHLSNDHSHIAFSIITSHLLYLTFQFLDGHLDKENIVVCVYKSLYFVPQ